MGVTTVVMMVDCWADRSVDSRADLKAGQMGGYWAGRLVFHSAEMTVCRWVGWSVFQMVVMMGCRLAVLWASKTAGSTVSHWAGRLEFPMVGLLVPRSVVQSAVKKVDGRVAMLAILMAGQWVVLMVDLKVAQ